MGHVLIFDGDADSAPGPPSGPKSVECPHQHHDFLSDDLGFGLFVTRVVTRLGLARQGYPLILLLVAIHWPEGGSDA